MQEVVTDPERQEAHASGLPALRRQISTSTWTGSRTRRSARPSPTRCPTSPSSQAYGGPVGGELAGSCSARPCRATSDYDPYGKLKKPQGDLEKAKKLLKEAGKEGTKLTYAYHNAPEWPEVAVAAIKDALEKAGFDVQTKEIDRATPTTTRSASSRTGTTCTTTGWGHDWPTASTVVPPLFDGRQVAGRCAELLAHQRPAGQQGDRTASRRSRDPDEAAKEWGKLADKTSSRRTNPTVPLYYYKQIQLYGSKIGGAVLQRRHRATSTRPSCTSRSNSAARRLRAAGAPAHRRRRPQAAPPSVTARSIRCRTRAASRHASLPHPPVARRRRDPADHQRRHVLPLLRRPAGPGDARLRQELHAGDAGGHPREPGHRRARPGAVLGLHGRHRRRPRLRRRPLPAPRASATPSPTSEPVWDTILDRFPTTAVADHRRRGRLPDLRSRHRHDRRLEAAARWSTRSSARASLVLSSMQIYFVGPLVLGALRLQHWAAATSPSTCRSPRTRSAGSSGC